jgi:hypothetical protein
MSRIVCAWCQTVNQADAETCLACGAPVGRQRLEVTPDLEPALEIRPTLNLQKIEPAGQALDTQDLQRVGETAEQVYNQALNLYGLIWRTLGEAFSIALCAFMLGLLGGATSLAFWGVLAGAAIGLAVGLVAKNFWLHLLTPLALLVGAGIGLLPWALGFGPGGMLLFGLVAALLAAGLGRQALQRSGWWERLRPFVGAAGGLFFSLLGALAGAGLQWLVGSLGQWFGN